MSFGWSAGDILAALKALKDVYDLLDDCDGAAGDYREATAFLKSLTQTLEQLATFTHWAAYPAYGDEIKTEVGIIKVPVLLFLQDVKKYEPSLGNPAKSGRLHGIIPKMKWHFTCSKKVVDLKKTIDSRLQILNSLIQRLILDVTITMQKNLPDTLRTFFHETIRPGLVATLDEVLRQQMQPAMPDTPKLDVSVIENLQVWDDVRLCLEQVKSAMNDTREMKVSLETFVKSQDVMIRHRNSFGSHQSCRNRHSSEMVHWSDEAKGVDERNRESLRELYYLVMVYLGRFLRDFFVLLSRMVQPTRQLTPTLIAKFHITFLDAMGGTPRVLQYDAFRHFETLQAFIKGEFSHVPLIAQKRYLIFDENDRALTESNWRDAITPGSKIAMSAILRTMRSRDTMTKSHECPNKFCRRPKLVQVSRAWLKCSGCGKQYFIGSFESRENQAGRSDSGPLPKPPTSPRQHTGLRSGPSQEPPGGVDEFDESIFATLRIQSSEMEEDDETSVFLRVLPEFDDMWSALARINPDSPYDPFEIGHLREKFPGLSGEHVIRLGKANSIRRRVLRHWRERQPEPISPPESPQDSAKVDYNVVTSFSFIDPFPREDMTTLRRARVSLARRDSKLSVYSQHGYWGGQHYSQFRHSKSHCPMCQRFLRDISTFRSFRKHMVEDLRPYICMHADCQSTTQFFSKSREWEEHNIQTHDSHIFPESLDASGKCPICSEDIFPSSLQASMHSDTLLFRHIGRHMMDIALFTVPRQPSSFDSSAGGSESNNLDHDDRSHASIDSHLSFVSNPHELEQERERERELRRFLRPPAKFVDTP